jgi:hypothetical protein
MLATLHDLVGLALAMGAWVLPRHIAGAGRSQPAALALDAAPVAGIAALLFLAAGRPLFTGATVFSLGAGFAFAERTTRETLREPILFTALSELPQLFTHPWLYLPFAGTGTVIGGAVAAVASGIGLFVFEPVVIAPRPVLALVLFVVIAAAVAAIMREPLLSLAAHGLRRLHPAGEPFSDAAALGPIAMLITHGIIARAERRVRRASLAAPGVVDRVETTARPIILVQCESFFDARRLLPMLPPDLLPGYDAACRRGEGFGRFEVPAWGANTTRAEFAVLTGIAEDALGFDRFNPHHALARAPISSQVRRLREAGYRTICLHPFDRRFFRRDRVMPALGFDCFLGREVLGGSRSPPYFPDPDLAEPILRLVDSMGPRVFIFTITMGNHGPWLAGTRPLDPGIAALFDPREVPQGGELLRYLDGLCRSDKLLQFLIAGLERRHSDTLLAWYGDHLPSLPRAFRHFGVDDWRSDYAIWSAGAGPSHRRDLAAWQLGRLVVDMVLRPHAPSLADGVVREEVGA